VVNCVGKDINSSALKQKSEIENTLINTRCPSVNESLEAADNLHHSFMNNDEM
jgi:hypothetical protein